MTCLRANVVSRNLIVDAQREILRAWGGAALLLAGQLAAFLLRELFKLEAAFLLELRFSSDSISETLLCLNYALNARIGLVITKHWVPVPTALLDLRRLI